MTSESTYQPHENRGKHVRVVLTIDDQSTETTIDMTMAAPLENGFSYLEPLRQNPAQRVLSNSLQKALVNVHADAVQIVPATK